MSLMYGYRRRGGSDKEKSRKDTAKVDNDSMHDKTNTMMLQQ